MLIISKYKDYYDYLGGVYGVDNKLVLDRRTEYSPVGISLTDGIHVLCICGKIIEFYVKDYKIYFGNDIAQFHVEPKWRWNNRKAVYIVEIDSTRHKYGDIYYSTLQEDKYNHYTDLKKYYDKCPIFIKTGNSIFEYPKLDELGFNKVISAHDMWLILTEWIGRQVMLAEKPVPVGDDNVRILAAGFDLKTSFRNIK